MSSWAATLEIGHEAALRTKKTVEGFTHDWELFVRGVDGADIRHYVDRVVFLLHETFPCPRRVLKTPPYSIKESGYAGFNLPIEIHFKNDREPKKIQLDYDLYLQDAGPPVSRAVRRKQIFHSVSDEFRSKLLKGGAVSVSSSSYQDQPQTAPEEKTLLMMNKPKLSKTDAAAAAPPPKKVNKMKPDLNKSDNVFKNLFGTPLQKSESKMLSSGDMLKPKEPSSKSHMGSTGKSGDKDKGKAKSPHKDKDKDSKDSKDKDRDRYRDKRDDKKSKERSKERRSSPKRSTTPTTVVKERKDSKDKYRKEEKRSRKEKREHKENKHEHKIKDSKDLVKVKDSSKEKDSGSPIVVQQPQVSQRIDKKEKTKEKDAREDPPPMLAPPPAPLPKTTSTDRLDKFRPEKLLEEKATKHKHKKKDKEKHKDKHKSERKPEKTATAAAISKENGKSQSPVPIPAQPPTVDKSSLFGSPKSDEPKKDKLPNKPLTSLMSQMEDSSNSSKTSSRDPSPLSITEPVNQDYVEPPVVVKKEPEVKRVKEVKEESPRKKDKKERKKDKKAEREHEKKRKRKSEPLDEAPPEKCVVKEEQVLNNNSDDENKVTSTESVQDILKKESDDYMSMLRDLQHKIMGLKDHSDLQKVVQLIAETGRFEVSAHTFDFDLCLLDRTTVSRLQAFFHTV